MSATKGSMGKRRRAARLAAVQALYEMELSDHSATTVLGTFMQRGATAELDGQEVAADTELFQDLLKGVVERHADLDRMIDSAMQEDRKVSRMEVLMRCILRAGAYEILAREDIDPPLTISEYLTIASSFYSSGEPAFINGVLDRLASTIRSDDFEGPEEEGQTVDDE